jgi:predicted ArsR family transcriptional regulator
MTSSQPEASGLVAAAASSLLESPVRRAIVDLLANLPAAPDLEGGLGGLTAAELADRVGLHVSTVRFHLDQLVSAQLLESEFRAGRVGRPRKVYRFRPGASTVADPAEAYRALAELLAESWTTGDEGRQLSPEEVGERWARAHARAEPGDTRPAATPGAWLGKVGRTVDMLGRWGYSPELRTADHGRTAELSLRDCPFLALAHTNPEVVCGVHRGLLRGAMEAVGEPDTEVSLRPFVGPGRCLATLTHGRFADPASPSSATHPPEEST